MGTLTAPKPSLAFSRKNMPIGNQRKKHYSMLIQGLLTNGTLEWTKPYKYRNTTITFFSILFRPYQVMLNNVNSINVVTNTNDEK